jgi:glycine C-acetyltransferase/8-amino-7-oxononanoate synthase
VREAAVDATARWGVGAGASRLVSGTMTVHRRLEERLAAFKGTESAVLFGSGYLANVGVIGALAGDGDGVVFSDELNHASIVDGCRLARARTAVYRHCDTEHLEALLREAGARPKLIVTDSVFSMDGDVAPLAELVDLARAHGALLVVDEAHGTGCMGRDGRGAIADAGLDGQVDVIVGTLGKALGSYGAYAACSETVAQWLVNRARSLIFSTALPPPAVAAALAALEVVAGEPERRRRLHENADVLRAELAREGFDTTGSHTQIIPLVVGDPQTAVAMCEAALERGIFAQAIRPPTVPPGTSRLRLAVMATHTRGELRSAARALGQAALQAGFRPGAGPALPIAA